MSFPVASFFCLSLMIMVLSSGTLTTAVEEGAVFGSDHETGEASKSVIDFVLIPFFKSILGVIHLAGAFSPIDSLSTGRSITWGQLGLAFTQIVLLMGGVAAALGILFFHRRELATAQGKT